MEPYDADEYIRDLEHRYSLASASLAARRHEFEQLSRTPIRAPARLVQLAVEIEALGRLRSRVSAQISCFEDSVGVT